MSRFGHSLLLLICVAVMLQAADEAPLLTHQQIAEQLKVPPGFKVELAALPPLLERPMMACFDERGRLFVADSTGVNLPAAELIKDPPHSIRMLEDTDGDGKFDKSTVFADKLTFPMGACWYDGALYTCSPPSVWRLEDTDGDGVSDKRTELVTKFGSTGNAADIHGPSLAPDGRLYWCDGRHGHEIAKPDGTQMKGKAARIFRCKPDGSEVEVVCGGGMDNPVEVAFTDEGEALATVALMVAFPKRIDTIIHCIEGGVFPREDQHEMTREFKRTGELLPAVVELGWVAPSGLMRYRNNTLGAAYTGNLFAALFNTHKVQRQIVERDGATFRARSEDFVSIDYSDFHPTDVLEDADGSLLIVDTGGWFRIGCPNSRISKPEIKGGIYRVRKTDAPPVADPRGLTLDWNNPTAAELVSRLADARPAVVDRAILQLSKLKDAVELKQTLQNHDSPIARRNAVWALCRMDGAEAREATRVALGDKEWSVRLAATHSIGLNHDADAVFSRLIELVKSDPHPAVKREAATALGRLRRAEAVPALLEGLRGGADRFLEHAAIYALIHCAGRDAMLQALRDEHPAVRRAALIVLDQHADGQLMPEMVAPLLDPKFPAVQQTALNVMTARPAWSAGVQELFKQWLTAPELDAAQQANLRGVLTAFERDPWIQDEAALALRSDKTVIATRLALLETIARLPGQQQPPIWTAELRWNLSHADERVVRQAIAAVRATQAAGCEHVLLNLAGTTERPTELRVEALAAAAPRVTQLPQPLLDFLIGSLHKDREPLIRLNAADALGQVALNDGQLSALAGVLKDAGAMELPKLLGAFERGKKPELGRKLADALNASPAVSSLTPEAIRRAFAGFPADIQKLTEPLLKKLDVDTEEMKARLKELEGVLAGGDADKGRAVFFGKKAVCATCHAVGTQGGRVGPDLTKISGMRGGRDLLESIVYPSASFVRGFEPYLIKTKAGKSYSGVIARETPDAVFLYGSDHNEIALARTDIADMKQSRTSIMPQGLDNTLTREELADLFAYLLTLK